MAVHATVKRVGVDCEVGNFRAVARNHLKELKQWNFQISTCKRIHFIKRGNTIFTRGESTYQSDLGKNQVLTKPNVQINRINPDVVERKNYVSNGKRKDVEKLLVNHYGADWRENEDLIFYREIIDGENVAENEEEELLCAPE